MTHKPPQGIDAGLRIDEAFIDAVEDEVGIMSGGWDNVKPAELCEAVLKVAKLSAPPDPRKDLADLGELVTRWRARAWNGPCPSTERAIGYQCCADELEQRLAEMRGAKK